MKISLSEVQNNIAEISNREKYTHDIIFELLAAYGRAKAAITQLRTGHLNKADDENAVLQKDVVYFHVYPKDTQLESKVQELYEDPLTERYKPRYLIVTDLINIAAKDTVKGTTLSIKLADIDNELDFFYAWTGDEVVDTKTEAVADRRAADKMNELYVEIEKENREQFASNPNFRHELNVFFTRLLFCFFAEDTGIYQDKQFTNAIKRTQLDGSDLSWFFGELFKSLDTSDEEKSSIKSPFKEFPYVNGSIFNTSKHSIAIPKFSAQARHLILECGRQNWGEINPDIFGTMFQGIIDPDRRDENGIDYTSVPNIMKVIKPLFLDDLHEKFDKYFDNEKKLWALLNRISAIKIFDPACGSGNFLIISYKELRQLQHAIIGRISDLKSGGFAGKIPSANLLDVDHLYGIEIDDFARELAILSIFLAKHQMNMEFNKQFGTSLAIIPLIELNTIVCDNATRIDWHTVCPNTGHTVTAIEQSALFELEGEQAQLKLGETTYDEIYLIGNPPYKGSRKQTADMKKDMQNVFENTHITNYRVLDYICIWFYKGFCYIKNTKAELAFVSTNSICQGDQVGIFWPTILSKVEVGFAYTSFKWQNSARDQAGVTCVIVSLRNPTKSQKLLFRDGVAEKTDVISAYLSSGTNTIVTRRKNMLSKSLPLMSSGNYTGHAMNLTLNKQEYEQLLQEAPNSKKLLKKLVGSDEMIKGLDRWCLWISDSDYDFANSIPVIKERIDATRKARLGSKDPAANKLAKRPHQFRDRKETDTQSIVIPVISSENRDYIPIGIVNDDTILSNRVVAIYNADLYMFGLLTSAMHMTWLGAVCGRLETRYSYSVEICYTTFPVHPLTENDKAALNSTARRILLARAAHPEMILSDMYNPKKMPPDLREAHNENDHLVDEHYKKGGFKNDEERLATLFDLYEKMTEKENSK